MDTAASSPIAIQMIPLSAIHPSPLNPRKHFDKARLAELSASIAQKGIRSPLQVRPGKKAGTFELIAGERRWTAAGAVELVEAPCLVTPCTDDELVELALTENGQREDLTPMDEARAYQAAMKANPKHYTVAVVAGTVGKSESYVYRRLKLLELAADLQTALDEDRLSIAHAEKLMRLPLKLQKEATSDSGRGVVWSRSPLLRYNEKWVPSKEDLLPLNTLEQFIREKSHFNPASPDTKYLQPELIEQISDVVDERLEFDTDLPREDATQEALASLVELTLDPMARSRMGVSKDATIPLTPSKWKEVKPGACEFAQRGVITHGGAARVLHVCIKKSCKKHWQVAKKAKASKAAKSTAPKQETWQERQAREDAKHRAEQQAFKQLLAEALPKLVDFTKGVTFSAALARLVVSAKSVEREFGVALTDETAAHVLLLSTIDVHWREGFLRDVKDAAPKFLPELQRIEAAQKKAAADQVKAAKKAETKTAKPAAAKKGKKR